LERLGWDSFFEEHFQTSKVPGSVPGRVVSESRGSYQVQSQYRVLTATIAGKMRYWQAGRKTLPVVGDWVAMKPLVNEDRATIHAVLPRRSRFSRKVAGRRTEEQVVSANIDTVFIVSGLDGGRNLSLRRIERYLALARSSGATPVVVLNKVDLCPDVDSLIREVEDIAPGTAIHPVSATEMIGLDALRRYLTERHTVAFLGSSGVGKSALINALLGTDRQEIGEVREDDHRGRHTTTKRELIMLPGGGMVIDTPGMREIQMWEGEDGLQDTFCDVETLSRSCRFNDCSHNAEPGCAVREAIASGDLDPSRLNSYKRLQEELTHLAAREQDSARLQEKSKWKKISQLSKETERRF
jgi:ribosome biogenesis GTPase